MKKTLTAITLAAVMTLGTTFANAGIIVAGKSGAPASCGSSQKDGIIVAGKDGIIVAGKDGIIVAGLVGIIVAGFTGIIISDATTPASTPCTTEAAKDGIIVAG